MPRAVAHSISRRLPPWPVSVSAAALLLLIGYPVAMLGLQSLWPRLYDGRLDGFLSAYRQLFTTPGLGTMLLNSLRWAGATTVLAWAMGIPCGYLLARTDLRARWAARLSLLVPVMTPPYVMALSYVLLMQPGGLADQAVGPLPDTLRALFFSFWGITLVMALATFAYVALAVEAALRGIPSRLEDAASLLGASRARIACTIVLPLLLPAILNAGLLVFLDALSNFGVPAILGPRSNILLLPAEIYYLVTTWPVNLPLATALSSLLLLMALLGVGFNRVILRTPTLPGGRASAITRQRLGPIGQLLAWLFFGGLFALSAIAPFVTMILASLIERWDEQGAVYSLAHYRAIFEAGSTGRSALTTSLWLSLVSAVGCTALGALAAYALARYRHWATTALDGLALLPRVLPKIVVAVALILAWNAPWVQVRIYGTVWILVIAYLALYLSDALRLGSAGMGQVPQRMELAAQSLGASRGRTLRTVVFPLLRASLVAAWATTFVTCLRDLVASVMLLPAGVHTIGSFIFGQFDQGDLGQAMAMATVGVGLGVVVLLAILPLRGGDR